MPADDTDGDNRTGRWARYAGARRRRKRSTPLSGCAPMWSADGDGIDEDGMRTTRGSVFGEGLDAVAHHKGR